MVRQHVKGDETDELTFFDDRQHRFAESRIRFSTVKPASSSGRTAGPGEPISEPALVVRGSRASATHRSTIARADNIPSSSPLSPCTGTVGTACARSRRAAATTDSA